MYVYFKLQYYTRQPRGSGSRLAGLLLGVPDYKRHASVS